MKRRDFLRIVVGGVVGGAALACAAPLRAAGRRPNFLFVYTDDQRWDAMGVVQREQGERARFPWFKSPNMDRLAAGGVPMTLEPAESRFVVFSRTLRAHVAALKPAGETESAVPGALVLSDKKRVTLITWQNMAYDVTLADKKEYRVGGVDLPPPQVLSDGWQTTFLEGLAGTAQSRITFSFKKPGPADLKARIMLDLGSVVNMARVVLNGKSFDTLWCAPYRLDVTDAICGGENTLEVFVTGTTAKRLEPASPVPSGVAGPVRILVGAEILLESGN